jgi:photosystem II stability/assembly factor-like uncharacterized protein
MHAAVAACLAALALGGCASHSHRKAVGTTQPGPLTSPSKPVAFGFFDTRRAVMTTLGGSLMVSDDGGQAWRFERRLPLIRIDVVSRGIAFGATGALLWRTDDGGLRWRVVANVAGALSFANPLDGWVTEARKHPPPKTREEAEEELRPTYVVWSTDDGGRSFRRLTIPCRDDGDGALMFPSMSRVTAAFGFVGCALEPSAGQQLKPLFVTHDGGRTWAPARPSRLPSSGYLSGLSFSSAQRGLLIRGRLGLSSTDDGGRNWQLLLLTDDVNAVTEAQRVGSHGLAALLFTGSLLYSRDEGCDWQTIYAGPGSRGEGQPGPLRKRPTTCR